MANKVTPVRKYVVKKATDKYWFSTTYYYEPHYGVEYISMSELLKDEDNYLGDDTRINFKVKYKNKSTVRVCSFKYLEFDMCCGMRELGDLSSNVLEHKDMDEIFVQLFEDVGKTATFVITTISSQKLWEEYLTKTKHFQAVKSFINNNTNNKVTLWVSTN